ncbi:MAG: hypothetical protein HC904_14215 [Blastochloris sp.]|nr:hypothetical protein [Blastochloris sp.]
MEFNSKVLRAAADNESAAKTLLGSGTAAAFVDPWSQPYRFVADSNYDNEIEVPGATAGAVVTINASLAIWSVGPQKVWNDELNPDKNFIRSWK